MTFAPRKWQEEAVALIVDAFPAQRSFLIEAGVGSGKTLFSAMVAKTLHPSLPKVVTVAPQAQVKQGFVRTFAQFGIQLDGMADSRRPQGFHGFAVTYQGLLSAALEGFVDEHTLVIFDEPHHLADDGGSAWGQAALRMASEAGMVLLMTGTPWRDGEAPIPFCNYEENDEGQRVIVPDYRYSYADSVRDNVCARVAFRLVEGEGRFRKNGKEVRLTTSMALTAEDEGHLRKTLLDPAYPFAEAFLFEALALLEEVRSGRVTPNPAALIVCEKVSHASAVSRLLAGMGVRHVTVTGDDPKAQAEIDRFRKSAVPVIVAVKLISEGTDIPRVKVVGYYSNVTTSLFLTQVMGRTVRKTQGVASPESAWMVMPALPAFKRFAASVEHGLLHSIPVEEEDEEEPEGMPMEKGAERRKSLFETLDARHTGGVDLTLFSGGFALDPSPPLSDRRADLRTEVAETAKALGTALATKYGMGVGEAIQQLHRFTNGRVAGARGQEDMSVEELEAKMADLEAYAKANDVLFRRITVEQLEAQRRAKEAKGGK